MTDSPEQVSNSTLEAKFQAQRIAFGPIMFQAAKVARDSGLLRAVLDAGRGGLTTSEAAEAVGLSRYGATVLLEAGASAGLVALDDGRYRITKAGVLIEKDELTRVNMDFVHDVCYQGMFHLEEAIREGKPAGLATFGDWPTIYEGLASLPEHVQKSWFAFDHYYSDNAFPLVLPILFERAPKKIMDIGGNTGKFAVQCATHDSEVEVTIADLPGQLDKAMSMAADRGFADRIHGHTVDLLDDSQRLPAGFDVVWMSQFLCCFSETEVVSLLRRALDALSERGSVFIMDTLWDRQQFEVSTYCLHASSLYFTCLANGNSRMYDAQTLIDCVEKAGMKVVRQVDDLGITHTLLECRPA